MSITSMRKRAGLTQEQVAEALGITDSAVCQWEAGATAPRASRLMELAKLFHCTVDDLVRED